MPLHVQLIITMITGSIVLCLLLGLSGYLLSKGKQALPAVPLFPGSNFPGFFSIFYTAFFIITFGMASIQGCIANPAQQVAGLELSSFISSSLMQLLLYLPFIIIYAALPSRESPGTSIGTKFKWIFLCLLAMVLPEHLLEFAGLSRWIVETTGCPPMQDVVEVMKQGSLEIKLAMIVMAVIVAPITEECCFRGFVYNILKRWNGPVAAAIASSLLFSAVHSSIAQFIPLTLFALVQCYAYEKARSLWLPIVLHMLFNLMSCLVILFLM